LGFSFANVAAGKRDKMLFRASADGTSLAASTLTQPPVSRRWTGPTCGPRWCL